MKHLIITIYINMILVSMTYILSFNDCFDNILSFLSVKDKIKVIYVCKKVL